MFNIKSIRESDTIACLFAISGIALMVAIAIW
jgi:hypothetical protein